MTRYFDPTGHAGYIFPVTAQVLTSESCETGDFELCGYCDYWGRWSDEPDCWDFRSLLEHLPGGRWEGDGSSIPRSVTLECDSDGWLTSIWRELASTVDDPDDVLDVSFSVHRPHCITDASWLRVLRHLGWKPYRW